MKTFYLNKNKLKQGVVFIEFFGYSEKMENNLEVIKLESEEIPIDIYYDEESSEIKHQDKYFKYIHRNYNLEDGEYVSDNKILKKEYPEDGKKYYWFENEWKIDEEEEMSRITNNYFPEIDKIKQIVLNEGFEHKGHFQKCRDKDIAYIQSTKSTIKNYKEDYNVDLKIPWSYNDTDIELVGLDELKELEMEGMIYVTKVFITESYLKSQEPHFVTIDEYKTILRNINITIEDIKKYKNKELNLLDLVKLK